MIPNKKGCSTRCALAILIILGSSHVKVFAGTDTPEISRWSIQVYDLDDPGDINLEPAFRVAIYENLLDELAKAKRFKKVFRSGDRNASGWPDLFILKTTVQNDAPGSETRRAVITVSGATRLKVKSQLCTREGRVVWEGSFDGNVRWSGSNLRATRILAHNVADVINPATLDIRESDR